MREGGEPRFCVAFSSGGLKGATKFQEKEQPGGRGRPRARRHPPSVWADSEEEEERLPLLCKSRRRVGGRGRGMVAHARTATIYV